MLQRDQSNCGDAPEFFQLHLQSRDQTLTERGRPDGEWQRRNKFGAICHICATDIACLNMLILLIVMFYKYIHTITINLMLAQVVLKSIVIGRLHSVQDFELWRSTVVWIEP